MNSPKFITVAVVAALFLFTGIAFGQWPGASGYQVAASMASDSREGRLEYPPQDPEVIVTANVGCQSHLAAGTSRPVLHWIEMLK